MVLIDALGAHGEEVDVAARVAVAPGGGSEQRDVAGRHVPAFELAREPLQEPATETAS